MTYTWPGYILKRIWWLSCLVTYNTHLIPTSQLIRSLMHKVQNANCNQMISQLQKFAFGVIEVEQRGGNCVFYY